MSARASPPRSKVDGNLLLLVRLVLEGVVGRRRQRRRPSCCSRRLRRLTPATIGILDSIIAIRPLIQHCRTAMFATPNPPQGDGARNGGALRSGRPFLRLWRFQRDATRSRFGSCHGGERYLGPGAPSAEASNALCISIGQFRGNSEQLRMKLVASVCHVARSFLAC